MLEEIERETGSMKRWTMIPQNSWLNRYVISLQLSRRDVMCIWPMIGHWACEIIYWPCGCNTQITVMCESPDSTIMLIIIVQQSNGDTVVTIMISETIIIHINNTDSAHTWALLLDEVCLKNSVNPDWMLTVVIPRASGNTAMSTMTEVIC